MKKKTAILLAFAMGLTLLAGCKAAKSETKPEGKTAQKVEEQAESIRIGGLKGPTSMGMVKMMNDAKEGKTKNAYEFSIAGSADEVTPKLIKGELDMAAVPANLASVIYQNSKGAVEVLAINTLGVVYIVENGDNIQSIADLKGKTIYATGKGTAPEYTLSYVLSKNGIDPENDLTIEWKSEPTEVVALMKQNPGSIAMLPQPFVTVAQTNIEGLRIAADLTKEWEKVDEESTCVTGVLVARRDFVEKYENQVQTFLDEYKASAAFANEKPEEAAELIEAYDIVKAAVAKKAIPYCNITFIEGAEMKQKLSGYLSVLYEQMPQAVGGEMPKDDFYYER